LYVAESASNVEASEGTAPALAENKPSMGTSDDNINDAEPGGTASEAESAVVACAPATEDDQPNASSVGPNAIDDSNTDAKSTASTDRDGRFTDLMMKCTKALELCLTRFPQHYKSLYRLADIFYRCSVLKVRCMFRTYCILD